MKVVETDREKGSLLTDQRAKRRIREGRELWNGRKEKERQGEKEREKEQNT